MAHGFVAGVEPGVVLLPQPGGGSVEVLRSDKHKVSRIRRGSFGGSGAPRGTAYVLIYLGCRLICPEILKEPKLLRVTVLFTNPITGSN